MLIPITEASDPRVAGYMSVREKDLVGRDGLFMAEGEVVLRLLLSRPDRELRSILVSQSSAIRMADLLAGVPDTVPVYVAAQGVMDALVGFHIHRGVLALVAAPPQPDAGDLLASLPARALVVGLVGLANHDNMGGIFRNAAAFGAAAVLLDQGCCDPLYRKAIRVSVGASLIVPYARVRDGAAMVRCLDAARFRVVSLSPAGNVATTSGIVLHHLAAAPAAGDPPAQT
ncbi:MAG: hypothetical protein B7Z15_13100 [Rhizobiales bacterium 32-66-8]|nr:MAG: hypothetical protein B7Z15_13100 [Rhizobiales bacterium 32-66-8]